MFGDCIMIPEKAPDFGVPGLDKESE